MSSPARSEVVPRKSDVAARFDAPAELKTGFATS